MGPRGGVSSAVKGVDCVGCTAVESDGRWFVLRTAWGLDTVRQHEGFYMDNTTLEARVVSPIPE
jgi:hypothetical protein